LTNDSSEKSAERYTQLLRGSRLKARRTALGVTQKRLSDLTGIDVKLIRAYERDKIQPRAANQRLLLDTLDGISPKEGDAARTCRTPQGDAPENPQGAAALSDLALRCVLRGEVARLTGSREAKILVSWTDENGLAVIAAGLNNRLVTIRASVTPSTLDDVRALHALADRLGEQLLG
jgi:transcriptional regulator with XRE-family HTH domain